MMLRSSSTPILGSLLSSCSDSPNHANHSDFRSPKHLPKKFSLPHQTCPLNLITPSSFSGSSPSVNNDFTCNSCHSSQGNGMRRVQSDGNLEGLASASCNSFDEFSLATPMKKFPRKPKCSVLETIPSFSVSNPRRRYEDDEENEEDEEYEDSGEAEEERNGDIIIQNGMSYMNNIGILQEKYFQVDEESDSRPLSKMHLAMGLGVPTGGYNGGGGNGGYNEYKPVRFGDDGGEGANMAEHYKKMVEDNPGNPLILRNYAEFLHKSKDLGGAEEYYSRAILVDPGDGEILSQYAQVTWELHSDEERASSYFERAVQASPENSHVLAAYASFLWETEEDDDDTSCTIPPIIHQSATAIARA